MFFALSPLPKPSMQISIQNIEFAVPSSTVYRTLAHRLVCRHNIDHVINDERNRIIIVVLAKHEIDPWWWFLREPKHVGAIVGILIFFNIPIL